MATGQPIYPTPTGHFEIITKEVDPTWTNPARDTWGKDEPAEILLAFLRDVERENVRINFDPANMILYGTGDPIDALRTLAPHVVSVHCKDGDWPPKDAPGALVPA